MEKLFETKYGDAFVRSIFIEIDLHLYCDGIEIKLIDYDDILEIPEYFDVDELTIEKVEELIEYATIF